MSGEMDASGEMLLTHVRNGLLLGGMEGFKDLEMTRAIVNDAVLARAARRWAQERVSKSEPLEATEVERVRVYAHALPQEEHLRRGGKNPAHWRHCPRGEQNEGSVMLVGFTFNKRVTGREALKWACVDSLKGLRGSGSAAMAGYLELHPYYDGRGPRHFPDEWSRWMDLWTPDRPGECIPGLWHDFGRMGTESLDWIDDPMSPGHIFYFVQN